MNLGQLVDSYTEGYTMDLLANSVGQWELAHGYLEYLDLLPFSLDSRVWTGNDVLIGAIGTDFKLGYFTGDPLTATLETGEVEINEGQKTTLLRTRPVFSGDSQTVTAQIGSRNLFSATVTYSSVIPLDALGDVQSIVTARYLRFRLILTHITNFAPPNYTFSQGFGFEVLEQAKAGKR